MATKSLPPAAANWTTARLSDVTEVVNGGTPKSRVSAYWGGGNQWLTPADMGKMKGRTISATPRTISEEGLRKCSARLVPPQSVILSTRAPIGHLAINEVPMAFNQGCRGLVPGDKLDHVFLYYFLQLNGEKLNELGTGATFKELSATNLKSVTLPLPPLEEQRRIVAILDQAFAAIDSARDVTESNLTDAEELFDNWLMLAFEQVRGKWPEKTLPEISENLDRQRVPITKGDREPGTIPYYGASGVVDYVAGYLFDEDLLLVSEDGANLLARTYPIAFSVSGKAWVNNHAHVLRFGDRTDQEFVRLYLESISIRPYVSGMAQPKLNQKALNRISIPYPGLDARSVIVAKAESLRAASDMTRASYESQLEGLDDLRGSLLQKAFAGELT